MDLRDPRQWLTYWALKGYPSQISWEMLVTMPQEVWRSVEAPADWMGFSVEIAPFLYRISYRAQHGWTVGLDRGTGTGPYSVLDVHDYDNFEDARRWLIWQRQSRVGSPK